MNLKSYIPTYTEVRIKTFEYKFTVFTPVFNRADTIHRVFDSLNSQTFRDFELVIINDGSTDNTHNVTVNLINNATFKVNYINHTVNKHKMGCFFEAIHLAKGEFIIILDSDDACVPGALKIFNDAYDNIPYDKKQTISGVTGLCMNPYGSIIGDPFPEGPYYSSTFERQAKFPSSSEKWGFTKTDILKGLQINPDLFSRGLIPEGIIWEYIAKLGYQTKYINEVVRIFHEDATNRLSDTDHHKNSFGMSIYSLSILNWFYKDYLWTYPKYFLKRTYTLLRAAHYLKFKRSDYSRAIDSKFIKIFFNIFWASKRFLK